MYKKFFLIVLSMFMMSCAHAGMTSNDYVSAVEQKLFGMTYSAQPLNKRIDRIEMQIYENVYSGSNEERLSKIDKIYPREEFEYKNQKSLNNSNGNNNYYNNTPTDDGDEDYIEQKQDYLNYPVVNEIEQSIFQTTYQNEDIYKRLSRLEKRIFGTVKSGKSLQTRVNDLKIATNAKNKTANNYNSYNSNNDIFNNQIVPNRNYNMNDNINFGNAPEIAAILNELEYQTFHKTYSKDNISRRMERLESYYYGASTTGFSQGERLSRLTSTVANSRSAQEYFSPDMKSIQWASVLMNLLVIALGILI